VSETEQLVLGGMWDLDQAVIDSDDIVVPADAPLSHWVFANTGLNIGDSIPGLIGTEYNETSNDPAITPQACRCCSAPRPLTLDIVPLFSTLTTGP
jgi:hypothetical protein